MKQEIIQKAVFGFAMIRSLAFTTQSMSLPFWEFLATGRLKSFDKDFVHNLKLAQTDLIQLLKKDSQNIADGIYPMSVLRPESLGHWIARYPKIIIDGAKIARRRLSHFSHDFDQEATEYLHDLPEYFKRNFHFQTGGYLTDKSAELYEHQVEILFSGAADAMRRLILAPLKKHFQHRRGEGLHFLEIAAGTGRLTKFVKLTFPKAKITVLDLSYPYLKKAQKNLSAFKRIDFVQGNAADLPFADEKFDAVYSCFMFHELPMEERKKVISESLRVLKPEGFLGLVDSIQEKDKQEFKWALQQFPMDFHEPFFKNYLQNPMEGLFSFAKVENIQTEIGFLSKVVTGKKSAKALGKPQAKIFVEKTASHS